MEIFNIQQLFIGSKLRFISLSFILVVFFFALPAIVNAQSISVTTTDPLCAGASTGSITIEVIGGTGPFVYYITDNGSTTKNSGSTSVDSHIFPDLPAGDYDITVTHNGTDQITGTATLSDPELSLSITPVKGWTCGAADGVGKLTLTFSEGANRTITVDVPSVILSSNSSPLTISDLYPGLYTFTLTDNACSSSLNESYTIGVDNLGPICTTVPVAETVDAADYLSSTTVIDTVLIQSFTTTGGSRNVSTYTVFNSSSRNNIGLQLLATPTGNTWAPNDTIKVEVSYDNGTTWSAPVIEVVNGGTPANTWIPLNNNQQDIQMRVICVSSSVSDYYTVDHLYVRGINPSKTIVTSGPSDCSDNYAPSLTITPSDGAVTWYCTTAGSPEFSFNRTWSVFDGCNYTNINQLIAVGEYPEFTSVPASVVIDNCVANYTVTIPVPTVQLNCDGTTPTLERQIVDADDESIIIAGWTTDLSDYTFTSPDVLGKKYNVIWRITDDAGFVLYSNAAPNASQFTQTVTFTPAISAAIDITTPDVARICQGDPVTFRITPSGGSGSFDGSNFDPATGSWVGTNYTYTTNWPTAGNYKLDVIIKDITVAGTTGTCTSGTISSAAFDVRTKIQTGAITRMP
jgi:hypothetical protein